MNNDHAQTASCAKTNFSEAALPSVTVVTVVYNDVQNIEKTILSVINQQYPRLEYIVIDGGSTDGTVDIIKKYDGHIDCWISEKDNGIYDAMNKGIDLASGEWINFMNADDIFFNELTIYSVFKDYPKDADFLYGDIIQRDKGKDEYIGTYRPLNEIWKGMPFCHQALFSKTLLLKQYKFSPSNKISSDYESVFFHYINGRTFFNCNKTIAIVSAFGASGNTFLRYIERWRFARKHMTYKVDIYYAFLIPTVILMNNLPPWFTNFIMNTVFELKPVKKARNTTTTTLIKKNCPNGRD